MEWGVELNDEWKEKWPIALFEVSANEEGETNLETVMKAVNLNEDHTLYLLADLVSKGYLKSTDDGWVGTEKGRDELMRQSG